MGDSYRPRNPRRSDRAGDAYHPRSSHNDNYRPGRVPPPPSHNPPPPPPPSMRIPLPPRPRDPPSGMYRFGGDGSTGADSYRPGPQSSRDQRDDSRQANHSNGNFSFRSNEQAQFMNNHDSYRDRDRDRDRARYHPQRRPPFRARPPPPHISERPILRSNREATPEQLAGMVNGGAKFADPDNLSESDGEMDLETDDEDAASGAVQPVTAEDVVNTTDDTPKWSNPDPYTALPPPDESRGKKRDVVQLIRKAKLVTTKTEASNPVADNDDFISFKFGDDEANDSDSSEDSVILLAPKGPAAMRPNQQAVLTGSLNQVPPPQAFMTEPPSGPRGSTNSKKRALDGYDDDGKLEMLPPKKKKTNVPADGRILPEWKPLSRNSTPWLTEDHSQTVDMGNWCVFPHMWFFDPLETRITQNPAATLHQLIMSRLHQEISDFYDFVKPQPYEDWIRQDLINRISKALSGDRLISGEVKAFGSFAAGLYLPTGDMDLVLLTKTFTTSGRRPMSINQMHKAIGLLNRANICQPDSTEVIGRAKVPIIKFVDNETGLHVDISFDNLTGVVANKTFRDWKTLFPSMPILVSLIKQFLLMRGLNEPFSGGLGGFSTICLVTSLIQLLPAIQSGALDPQEHLGEVLLEFFYFYGKKFDLNMIRLSMQPPGFVPKGAYDLNGKLTRADRLSIIDPNVPTNDISAGSMNVKRIFECFSDAYDTLVHRMNELASAKPEERVGKSILDSIIAGNYASFEWQRRRLRKVYKSRGGQFDHVTSE